MGHTVNYAVNPVKTAYDKAAVEEAGMTANIAYALNPEKGTTRLFQTAINLDDVETAWSDMKATKERWGKMDGIQGFHVVRTALRFHIDAGKLHDMEIFELDR